MTLVAIVDGATQFIWEIRPTAGTRVPKRLRVPRVSACSADVDDQEAIAGTWDLGAIAGTGIPNRTQVPPEVPKLPQVADLQKRARVAEGGGVPKLPTTTDCVTIGIPNLGQRYNRSTGPWAALQ